MIIEISGAGFHNMGAELMLIAAREELLSWGHVDAVAVGFRTGRRYQREQASLQAVLRLDSSRRWWANNLVALGSRIAPTRALQMVHVHKPSGVHAMVNASGFAFGDQWGPLPAKRLDRIFSSYTEMGKSVVLLPQAFGPFRNSEVAAATKRALRKVDLIYARDPESLAHVEGLGLTKPKIRAAPDFTNLLETTGGKSVRDSIVVVPNARMISMLSSVLPDTYLQFLKACTAAALKAGFRVIVVTHERQDAHLAFQLRDWFGDSVACMTALDAISTKKLVAEAAFVVSSRYHGLVNALSQQVPAVGTGWSHKYEHLFRQYGCQDALWDVKDAGSVVFERMEAWLAPTSLSSRREALKAPAVWQKREARRMWNEVRAALCLE